MKLQEKDLNKIERKQTDINNTINLALKQNINTDN